MGCGQYPSMFSSEVSILALYGLLVIFIVVVQSTATTLQLGLSYAASARDEGRSATGVAARLERTVHNSVTALAIFAPAALAVHLKGASSDTTILACQVFFAARVVYAIAYPAGVAYLRTVVWLTGFAATATLYVQAL